MGPDLGNRSDIILERSLTGYEKLLCFYGERERRNKLEKREMLCFFCGGEENATTWGSVARRKGRHAKNCGKQYGKGMSTDKLEGKSSAVFYHREDKSATTLRKKNL